MTRYFESCKDVQEVKATYRKMALANHPDRGGSTEAMAEINRQYNEALKAMAEQQNAKKENAVYSTGVTVSAEDLDGGYREVIEKLIIIEGIEIELCGTWLWISGETKAHKDEIKATGCRWSRNKCMWYWRPEGYRSNSRKPHDMGYIRNKWGSSKVGYSQYDSLKEA